MTTTNRLAHEASPYLRQHAENPVDWWPWGDEAFAEARRRDVPILLSVGYSACHWCHVMAHESFEDPDAAAVVNRVTVPVKVDREERPDVDAVYMEAAQAVNGSGGWPMTVLLLPDGRPFFAGTYFPRAAFVDLLERVEAAWTERRAGIEADAAQLAGMVERGVALPSRTWAADGDRQAGADPGLALATARAVAGRLDREWGGFGPPPKFPTPVTLDLLLAEHVRRDDPALLEAATVTLDAMAAGGIYDHLAGGFARYATDRRWLVPHFEKMLYDNAQLARTYLHAWQVTGRPDYRHVVEETVGYLLAPPIRQPSGGLSSAEDADAEGVEGKFATWSYDELVAVAGAEVADWYGATPEGNWEHTNILWRPGRGRLQRPAAIEQGRRDLLAVRERRVRPGLDDKVLTEWNAMAVAALAECGAALDRPAWVAAAEEVAGFLLAELRGTDGRWRRSWQAGSGARHLAYGADMAWLVEAFTRLAEATGRARWLDEAVAAAEALAALCFDEEQGVFTTAGRDAEALIARPVDTYDGATPSTNTVAAAALGRLGALTGDAAHRDRARRVLDAMAPAMAKAPAAFTGMVAVAAAMAADGVEVVVTGDRPDLVAAARAGYDPDRVLAWGAPYPSPLWEGRTGPGRDGFAYVCRGYVCAAPTDDPAEVTRLLAR
ncbi:MAG TPA: thioredoxin domain-containing protein [Acidimicrobiales bacterium]|nr:thioredoxin domain-containing protein [Acidimicrobiales bacterium]